MKQNISVKLTYKQKLTLNQNLVNSIDYLKMDSCKLKDQINQALESNPFLESKHLEYHEHYNYNTSNHHEIDDLYLQLYGYKEHYHPTIMDYIIQSLDHHGFLSYNDDIYLKELNIDEETFHHHINILKKLEPKGIGCKDAIDYILFQLSEKNPHSYKLLASHKELMLSHNYKKIKEQLSLTKSEIDQFYEDVKSCSMYPINLSTQNTLHAIPELEIIKEDMSLSIEPLNTYELNLNKELYQKVRNDSTMQEYFKNAYYLIDHVTRRNKTILIIMDQLVNIQKNHFLFDDELFPCTLETLASRTGYHVSTISRAISNKYFVFNNEVYPIKSLLSSKTKSGDSADSIKKAILSFIEQEDKSHPISDEKIVEELANIDLHCSRRTVAKYRQILHIPSSSRRKIKNSHQ